MKNTSEKPSRTKPTSSPDFVTSCLPVPNSMNESKAPYTDPEALLQARVLKTRAFISARGAVVPSATRTRTAEDRPTRRARGRAP
jgi:hypothetical protein